MPAGRVLSPGVRPAPAAVHVPGALVPAHCDVAHDHAVHVEPDVRVRHGP